MGRAVLPAVESKPCAEARRNCGLLAVRALSKSVTACRSTLPKNSRFWGILRSASCVD